MFEKERVSGLRLSCGFETFFGSCPSQATYAEGCPTPSICLSSVDISLLPYPPHPLLSRGLIIAKPAAAAEDGWNLMPLFLLFFDDNGIHDVYIHYDEERVMIFVMADVGNAMAVCLSVCLTLVHMGEYVLSTYTLSLICKIYINSSSKPRVLRSIFFFFSCVYFF